MIGTASGSGGGCNGTALCMLGRVNPLTQCMGYRVDAAPTPALNPNQISDSLNTRFDLYGTIMTMYKTDPNFAPSTNVTKGVCRTTGADCSYTSPACQLNSGTYSLPQSQPSLPNP